MDFCHKIFKTLRSSEEMEYLKEQIWDGENPTAFIEDDLHLTTKPVTDLAFGFRTGKAGREGLSLRVHDLPVLSYAFIKQITSRYDLHAFPTKDIEELIYPSIITRSSLSPRHPSSLLSVLCSPLNSPLSLFSSILSSFRPVPLLSIRHHIYSFLTVSSDSGSVQAGHHANYQGTYKLKTSSGSLYLHRSEEDKTLEIDKDRKGSVGHTVLGRIYREGEGDERMGSTKVSSDSGSVRATL